MTPTAPGEGPRLVCRRTLPPRTQIAQPGSTGEMPDRPGPPREVVSSYPGSSQNPSHSSSDKKRCTSSAATRCPVAFQCPSWT